MKEVRNLGRGLDWGVAPHLAPQLVTSWSATALAWTGPSFKSPRPFPTICRLWVACTLRVVRSPVTFLVATLRWPPVRCLVSSGGLLPAGTCWTLWQIVVTATPLRGHRWPGPGGHTPFLWPITLMSASAQWLHLGGGCRPTASKSGRRTWLPLDQRPPCWNGCRPFRTQGQQTRWDPCEEVQSAMRDNPPVESSVGAGRDTT